MFIESFLIKIAAAVFKKAAAGSALAKVGSAYQIYSAVDSITDFAHCIHSTNDCRDLLVCGLQVISDPLVDHAIEQLLGAKSHSFTVEETPSGIYVVNRFVSTFRAPQLAREFERVRFLATRKLENRPLIAPPLATELKQKTLPTQKLGNRILENRRLSIHPINN